MATERVRLDQLLVQQGLVPSRQVAQSLIMRGDVLIDDVAHDKPGTKVPTDTVVRIRGNLSRFVGRGGEKIDPLFDSFQISLKDRVVIDLGSSTGGFTDAMLQRGASRVYAVDVGHNQLAASLRSDPRVVVMEGTHANQLPNLQFDPAPDFAVVDVSFIGLRKVLPFLLPILRAPWEILALVKPQFELGPEFIEKGGLVSSEEHRQLALTLVSAALVGLGAEVVGSAPAALAGAKSGNQEYFVFARRCV